MFFVYFKEKLDKTLGAVARSTTEQRWETTMDPTVRHLLRVQIDDAIEAGRMFTGAVKVAGIRKPEGVCNLGGAVTLFHVTLSQVSATTVLSGGSGG